MKRLACIILILTILISGLSFVRTSVHATTVSGNITANTEWTINDSPIVLNSTVRIHPNATLKIDPGVTVSFATYTSMQVSGILTAIGSLDSLITFTCPDSQNIGLSIFFDASSPGWSDATGSGSIIQYANFNKVYVYASSSLKIDNCYFSFSSPSRSSITVSGGTPIISNNRIVFSGQDPGHYTYGVSVNSGATPVITNNEFEGNGQLTGINLQIYTPTGVSNSAFTISNNKFSNCWLGIKAETAATVTVQGNSFWGCRDGLDVNNAASLTIKNNLIDGCSRYGINGGGIIDTNTITNNQIGIHNPDSGTVISNNNIVGNSVNSVTVSSASVNAQNNWWGTTDVPTINQTIYDIYDDGTLGTIEFVPFLSGPSPSAPAIPATTPLVTPMPSVIVTQPPDISTPTPTIPPPTLEPTPIQKSEPILNDTSDMLNLNLMTGIAAAFLIIIWVIVILGYAAKKGISDLCQKKKIKNCILLLPLH